MTWPCHFAADRPRPLIERFVGYPQFVHDGSAIRWNGSAADRRLDAALNAAMASRRMPAAGRARALLAARSCRSSPSPCDRCGSAPCWPGLDPRGDASPRPFLPRIRFAIMSRAVADASRHGLERWPARGQPHRRPRSRRTSMRAGVARAALESLAENASDGVVAPAFWLALLRPARHRPLQGDQHRRLHDRPQIAALSRFRLGRGAARRSRQPAAGSRLTGLALRRARPGQPAARRRCRLAAMAAMPTPRLAQCRLAGSGAWPARWTSASAVRAPMAACMSTSPPWAMAGSSSTANDIRRGLQLYAPRPDTLLAALRRRWLGFALSVIGRPAAMNTTSSATAAIA